MYSQNAAMASQKPETFMLSTEAQQALPHDAQVALNQVDNCKWLCLHVMVPALAGHCGCIVTSTNALQ
jgi:transcription factor STE12